MPKVAKRPLTVVLLVVSIMAASAAPALAGSAGGTGNEGCGGLSGIPCLPPGECTVKGPASAQVVAIGTGNGTFNVIVDRPSKQLIERCGGVGKLGPDYEIPMDAADDSFAT